MIQILIKMHSSKDFTNDLSKLIKSMSNINDLNDHPLEIQIEQQIVN